MKRAIYAGTFDPITRGHLDVLDRALQLFDEIIVAVAPNAAKGPIFTMAERLELIRGNIAADVAVSAEELTGLTVDFALAKGAVAIIRGLRAVSDFEYEFQMAQMNRHLDSSIETIFLMPSAEFFYTSSNLVKQVARLDTARISRFVPDNVMAALEKKFPV